MIFHVVPLKDSVNHTTDGTSCHCKPMVEKYANGNLVIVHNSADFREFDESRLSPLGRWQVVRASL